MSESQKPKDSVPDKHPKVGGLVAPGRRRLLRGGMASSPVLLTLVSRPVLGVVQCVTPSAFCSGNVSAVGQGVICEGHTADYWLNNPNWPAPYTPDTPFNDVFGPNPDYQCQTLQDVLAPPDTGAIEPPASPSHGHRHHRDQFNDPGSRNASRHGSDTTDEPKQQSFERKSANVGALSLNAPDPATRNTLGQRNTRQGGTDSGTSTTSRWTHSQAHKHRKGGPDTGPVDPGTPDPGVPDPLSCNSNNTPAPDPAASDPGTPGRGRRRHRGNSSGRNHDQTDRLARNIVASLLNAHAGFTPQVNVATVKGIWHEYMSKGYFEPTAGVQWGLEEIQTYIASIQPA